eukprot:Nitzschia sp. Nitz4//scaffold234_size30613//23886//25775//NITZ4_007966-RA/size30613-processed-gene-0.17-mRNA-1//1//CDS//3329543425//4640//frame0
MFGNAKGAATKMAEMAAQMDKQKKMNRQPQGRTLRAGRGKPERPPGKPGFLGGFNKKAQSSWKSQMEARKEVFKNVAVAEDDEASGTTSSHCTPRDSTTWESTSHTSDLSTLKSVKTKNRPANSSSNNNKNKSNADSALDTLDELVPENASKDSNPKLSVGEEDIQALGESTTQLGDLPTLSLNCPVDDDDMTQITMDDSVWGDDSVNLGGSRRLSIMSRDSTDGSVWGDDSVKFGAVRRISRDSTEDVTWGDDSMNFGAVRRVSRDSGMGTLGSSYSGVLSSEDSVRLSKNNGRVHVVQQRRFRREKQSSGEEVGTKPREAKVDNAQLAQILRKDIWSQEKEVLQNALDRLVEVVKMGSSAQRETIARFGGIVSVLRVIDTNNDEKVLLSAYIVLEILSDEDQFQATIGELWGIPTICESLARNASNPTIQLAGCRTLDAIARCCQDETLQLQQINIPTEGAVTTLGRCLQGYPQDRDIQAHAFCAIADMCIGRPVETEELISSGAIGSMTVALTKKWTSKYKKDRAIEAMCTLMQALTQDDDEHEEEDADFTEYATSLKGDDDTVEYQEYAATLKDDDDGDEYEEYAMTLKDEDPAEGNDYTEYAMTLKDDDTDDFTEYAISIKGDT